MLGAVGGEVVALIATGQGRSSEEVDTLFEIASVTKQFTAAGVLRLAQEGKLGLDDSIADHLPGIPEECRAITVRHLLRHTSGIPGSNSEGSGEDLAAVLPLFLRGGPLHEPGTRFDYWNEGYALVSEIIARASGGSYTEYLRRSLFEPAGMTRTVFTGDAAPPDTPVARGHSRFGPARSALDHPYGSSYGFQYRGMGGVVTNAWDLWLWDRALAGDTILTEDSKTALFEPGLNGYALGWFVSEGPYGAVQRHGGGVRGFAAELRRYPERDGLIVVLSAFDGNQPAGLADALEVALFTAPGAPGEVDAGLRALVGTYTSPRGLSIVLSAGPVPSMLRAVIGSTAGPGETPARVYAREDGFVLDDGQTRTAISAEVTDGVARRLTLTAAPGVTLELERAEE